MKKISFNLQRKAFKVFNLESQQDQYSVKQLLDTCFISYKTYTKRRVIYELYGTHLGFCFEFFYPFSRNSFFQMGKIFCIHCGVNIY